MALRALENKINVAHINPHVSRFSPLQIWGPFTSRALFRDHCKLHNVWIQLSWTQSEKSSVCRCTAYLRCAVRERRQITAVDIGAPHLISRLSTATPVRLTGIWTDHANVRFHDGEEIQSGIFTHRAQEKYEITQYHLPMVFAMLAFKIMNSCRRTQWREQHYTALHSCSSSAAGIFLNGLIWHRHWNRKDHVHTVQSHLDGAKWNYKQKG